MDSWVYVGWSHITCFSRKPWICQTDVMIYSDAEYKWLSTSDFRILIDLKVLLLKIRNWNIDTWQYVGWSHISCVGTKPWKCQTNMIIYSDAE